MQDDIETPDETPEVETPEVETPPVETPETPPEETEETDPDAPETEEGEAPPVETAETAEQKERHRRKGGYSRTIEKQEREIDFLRQQLQRATPPPAGPVKEKTAAEQTQDYIDGLVEKKIAAREAAAEQARVNAEFNKRFMETKAKHADFQEVLDGVSHIVVPDALREALFTSELGPEIMYRLASNPVELARISALPPLAAAREVGRLEARASSTSPPRPQPKSAVRPPVPPTSVGGSSTKTRNLDDLPLSEYKKAFRSGR